METPHHNQEPSVWLAVDGCDTTLYCRPNITGGIVFAIPSSQQSWSNLVSLATTQLYKKCGRWGRLNNKRELCFCFVQFWLSVAVLGVSKYNINLCWLYIYTYSCFCLIILVLKNVSFCNFRILACFTEKKKILNKHLKAFLLSLWWLLFKKRIISRDICKNVHEMKAIWLTTHLQVMLNFRKYG